MGEIRSFEFLSGNQQNVIIRNACTEDVDSLIEINYSILSENIYMLRSRGEVKYNRDDFARQIEDNLISEGKLFIVAEVENNIAGYLQFENGIFKKISHAGMLQIFLHRDFRESGIGTAMLKVLIDWAEKNPLIEKLTLSVFSNNERAINLYKKSGFKEEGRCPEDMKFSDGTYVDSVLMYKFVK